MATGTVDDATVTQSPAPEVSLSGTPPAWEHRFRDIELAGVGGMARVYRAFDCTLSRPVALKVMRGDRSSALDDELRFRKEAAAMARLSHPNIVTVYDTGIGDTSMWMVLEWIEGAPLSQLLEHNDLKRKAALSLLIQTAKAVQHAHERGIVHRDLKPSNILIDGDVAKVADFGIAHFLSEDAHQTMTEAAIGTPRHMAPEQANPQLGTITVRTDVYALGVILYQVLSGKAPFAGENFATLVQAIIHEEPAHRVEDRIAGKPR